MKLIISALMFTIEQLMIKFSRKLWFHSMNRFPSNYTVYMVVYTEIVVK